MDTTEELYGYFYAGMPNLSASELFFWVMVDETMKQLGVQDIGATVAILSGMPILNTRQKPAGAIKGTSIASVSARKLLSINLHHRMLPTIVGKNIRTLKIVLVNNLGAFVGRTVPIVGWIILAYDVSQIAYNTCTHYNLIAKGRDKL